MESQKLDGQSGIIIDILVILAILEVCVHNGIDGRIMKGFYELD
jgi:hypothetical protein